MTPLSPFVPARRVITPDFDADGSRLPCRARATALVLQHPGLDLRPEHRRRFRTGSTQATLPHYGISQRLAATSTWPTKPGTGLPHPEAAVVPALASVFNPEVTLLGRVTARSVWVRAVFRQAALSRHLRAGFPPTKPEDRGTVPKQRFAIWLRLLRISLASPPLPIRLGLSWLSCSPPPDFPADAEVVTPVLPVTRQKLPTPAALNELAQPRKPEPHGRDFVMDRDPSGHPLCVPPVLRHRSSPQGRNCFTDAASSCDEVGPHRPHSFPRIE